MVPALFVVLSVLEVEVGGETSSGEGGGEGRGTGGQGKDGSRVLELRIEQDEWIGEIQLDELHIGKKNEN